MKNINEMKSINEMKIINRDYDLETGFFWVEFEGGKSLQCCLTLDSQGRYQPQIEIDNSGCYDGQSWDCNEWAANEDGEAGHIEEFLVEQAREIGIEIVA